MSETNTNTNETNGEQNIQQNNSNNNNSQQNNNTNQQTSTQQNNNVDVEKVKGDAIAEYLKSLGVENSDSLQAIVKKAKEDEEANKTDLQKKDDALTATTKELVNEREARVIAEAKLSAIQLGAKPELVDDLVIVAKAKVTKDKDINAVIAEMKDSTNGKIYFAIEEDETNKKGTVTRSRVKKSTEQNKQNTNGESNNGDSKYAGTMAERLLAGRKAVKSHYFK
nr:MAG TPA: Major capsid protein [Caudoviricetes sp.]